MGITIAGTGTKFSLRFNFARAAGVEAVAKEYSDGIHPTHCQHHTSTLTSLRFGKLPGKYATR
ncbi:hypothetical protein HPA02_05240 [Bisbaumannia pacifica]|uniref:Uncharacterized protein n=1 Tax=Bisbaumannia pacifica TaxID=77098 RepID=A0A510X5K6_9GAMM|nr:hypothetical protein HPA02_05240 [Halomonas pacifica]